MATFSTVAEITMTSVSVGDTNGRVGTAVDNSTDEYQRIHWYSRMKTAVAATVDSIVEFYFYREDDHGTQYTTDGEALADDSITATPQNAHMVGAMVFANSTADHFAEGVVEDPGPGRWTMGFMNETGQALSSTETDCFIHWVGEKA